jgi:Zn-dependent protease
VFLAEPQRTPYDLHFQIFGFDVRVSPFFWLAAALLGWQFTAGMNEHLSPDRVRSEILEMSPDERAELLPSDALIELERIESNPGQGVLLLIWIAAVFLSILIHELGHSLAMQRYGIRSYIVLYHFGGLAVPDSASSFMGMNQRSSPYQQINISAAGPAIQLALAGVVIVSVKLAGYQVPTYVPYLADWLHFDEGQRIASTPLLATIESVLWPSIFWALLNLLPVYPLDGGQISRELFTMYSGGAGVRSSLILSMVAAGGIAVWGLTSGNMMLAMMFAMLAFSSFQILQQFSGRGGYGPW